LASRISANGDYLEYLVSYVGLTHEISALRRQGGSQPRPSARRICLPWRTPDRGRPNLERTLSHLRRQCTDNRSVTVRFERHAEVRDHPAGGVVRAVRVKYPGPTGRCLCASPRGGQTCRLAGIKSFRDNSRWVMVISTGLPAFRVRSGFKSVQLLRVTKFAIQMGDCLHRKRIDGECGRPAGAQ